MRYPQFHSPLLLTFCCHGGAMVCQRQEQKDIIIRNIHVYVAIHSIPLVVQHMDRRWQVIQKKNTTRVTATTLN